MALSPDSNKLVNIESLYALKPGAVWKGYVQEHLSLWCLLGYYFFEYVPIHKIYKSIDVLPWPQLFMILSILAAFMDKSVSLTRYKMNTLFILFGVIIFISSVFSYYPSASWDYRNTMLGWIIIYFLTISIVNTEKRMVLFLIAYFIFNLKMGQHGAIEWVQRGFSFADFGLIGAPGWFNNSGEYAIQMLIYGSLSLAFVISLKKYMSKYMFFIALVAAATGYMTVMGASSRGSQLGLAAIVIMLVLKHKSGLKGIIVFAVLALVLYSIIPDEQMQRFDQMGEDRSSLQRLVYWKIGLELINEHPLFGIGYSNWMPHVTSLYPDGVGPLEIVEKPHSIYIEAASELGYSGFLMFLSMVGYAFYTNVKTRRLVAKYDNKLLFNLTYGLDAGLIGYLIAGAFVTVLYYPFFWIQISMIVFVHCIARKKVEVEQAVSQ